MKDVKTIFFDFDGTLHNSVKIYAPAFRKAYAYLVENQLADQREWSDDEISYWLGFTSKEMWRLFMPELDPESRQTCSKMIGTEMLNLLKSGEAQLYTGTIETLAYLKDKGYILVFLSNCGRNYMNISTEVFQLDRYFDDMVCAEDYDYIPKHEILKTIKGNYPEKMAIVGDRFHDIEAGKLNDIGTIGCLFGYHRGDELVSSDMLIDDISRLKELF